ncbi:MAG: hypothetical protein UW03_C0002G0035 [Candidatus Peregrinibacteria bacterium GW2011_GWA2_43_8]|nr:MAG: hypothetical protein UW03_C0002G0035 [Candidatus Peregrinibacteria bacterium GW2011_GWA2_43_8]
MKAKLLCLGARTPEGLKESLLDIQNPGRQKRAGLGYGVYADVEDEKGTEFTVNIDAFSLFAPTSPIVMDGDPNNLRFFEIETGEQLGTGTVVKKPTWINEKLTSGKTAGQVIQPHSPNDLTTLISSGTRCSLFDTGEQCLFCSLDGKGVVPKSEEDIEEALGIALSRNSEYRLISSSSFSRNPREVLRKIETIKKRFPNLVIALETVPFGDKRMYQEAKTAGADAMMMNLECYSDEARRRLCPGKSKIDKKEYFDGFEESVKVFGPSNTTSCLIVGMEPVESSMAGVRALIEAGVVPEVIPWRANLPEGTSLPNWMLPTNPIDLVRVQVVAETEMSKKELLPNAGCLRCGMCQIAQRNFRRKIEFVKLG